MSSKTDLPKQILKLLEENPIEWTITQIAKKINQNRTEVHFTVNALVSLDKIVPTRKSGNAQMYCLKGYEERFKSY